MFSVGLIGLPNAGKSTLFNLLTQRGIPAENFPFCTIDPNIGIVEVPDVRVDRLAKIENSQKKVYANIQFHDIAGLVKDAHKGEGLGNQFLSHIAEVDLILMVVRSFKNKDILHVENRVAPNMDEEILLLELCLKDQLMLEKVIQKLERELKGVRDPLAEDKIHLAEEIMDKLTQIQPASTTCVLANTNPEILKWRKSLNLLTDKPILKLSNISQEKENIPFVCDFELDILTEQGASELSKEERQELGLSPESGVDKLIQECYKKLNLGTFLTAGQTESRAWTFTKGWLAPKCAGVIHSDFEKKFVKAEIMKYQDFVDFGGQKGCAEKGLVKIEGKTYIMQDGDVVEFMIGK